MSEASPRLALSALCASQGFRSDGRFAAPLAVEPSPAEPELQREDPLALARAEGQAAGLAAARAEALADAAAEHAAREGLALSLVRLDAAMAESLHQRLRDAVAALCEAAIAPLALDTAMLERRIARAVAMLARADDERVIRLHPADLALIAPGLGGDWTVQADPALERGAIRVETTGGGIEDGPAQWRQAIAEALHQC